MSTFTLGFLGLLLVLGLAAVVYFASYFLRRSWRVRFERELARLEEQKATPPAHAVAANLGAVAQAQDAEAVALGRRLSAAYSTAAQAYADGGATEALQVGPGWFGVALALKSER